MEYTVTTETIEETTDLIITLVCRSRRLDRSQVTESTNLVDDLGFDSLDAAELLAALHKETGRQLNTEAVKGIAIYGQTIKAIAQSLLDFQTPSEMS
jgi:acyl carrier protein